MHTKLPLCEYFKSCAKSKVGFCMWGKLKMRKKTYSCLVFLKRNHIRTRLKQHWWWWSLRIAFYCSRQQTKTNKRIHRVFEMKHGEIGWVLGRCVLFECTYSRDNNNTSCHLCRIFIFALVCVPAAVCICVTTNTLRACSFFP